MDVCYGCAECAKAKEEAAEETSAAERERPEEAHVPVYTAKGPGGVAPAVDPT